MSWLVELLLVNVSIYLSYKYIGYILIYSN